MKIIEVDEELYRYIASNTLHIGESASAILRRLLGLEHQDNSDSTVAVPQTAQSVSQPGGEPLDVDQQALAQQRGAVGRFLYILGELYRHHGQEFAVVLDVKGRDRQYFADSKEALLSSGSSTNPKLIPGSPFWVITNNNTEKKRAMVAEVLEHLHYAEQQARDIIQLI